MLTRNNLDTKEAGRLSFRAPVADDGSEIHALVKRSKFLDVNSRYCYLILCEHFNSTCVVAEENNNVVAFVTAYIPPERRDTLFVWQIAVDRLIRGQGIAKKMIRHLLSRHHLNGISFIEATVNPSNHASRSLFQSLASECRCKFEELMLFSSDMFSEKNHEQENLIRVGPIDSEGKTLIGR